MSTKSKGQTFNETNNEWEIWAYRYDSLSEITQRRVNSGNVECTIGVFVNKTGSFNELALNTLFCLKALFH